jgi:hypothetical protein
MALQDNWSTAQGNSRARHHLLYRQAPQQYDLDHWELFADQVLPQLS